MIAARKHHSTVGRSDERFELIIANPPFLTPGSGWFSTLPQQAEARFERHGDVSDFCRVAARCLAPEGCFCLCHAAADPRPERAVEAAGLVVRSRQRIVLRSGRPPHLALWVCAHQGARSDLPDLEVRGPDGCRTEAFVDVLRQVGIAE